jgi:hypothetical protein
MRLSREAAPAHGSLIHLELNRVAVAAELNAAVASRLELPCHLVLRADARSYVLSPLRG